jgi:hypothetical protein
MTPTAPLPAHDLPTDDELGCGAAAIARRVRRLVAHYDRGDVCAAARRLGVPVQDLIRLDRLLAVADADGAAAADRLLVAAVLRYPVKATWLLTGIERPVPRALPPTVRLSLAELLLAVGTRIVDDYRARLPAERNDGGPVRDAPPSR